MINFQNRQISDKIDLKQYNNKTNKRIKEFKILVLRLNNYNQNYLKPNHNNNNQRLCIKIFKRILKQQK